MGRSSVAQLKWWARLVVTLWVLLVVPLLLLCLLVMVLAAPRVIGTAWESLGRERAQAALHWADGQYLEAIGTSLAMGVIALPVLLIAVILGRMLISAVKGLWRWTEGRPVRRAGAGAVVLGLAAVLALAWWPNPSATGRSSPTRTGRS